MRRLTSRKILPALIAVGAAALMPFAAPVHASAFTPGDLLVCRVGDGSAALTSAATAVFVDEYSPSGTLVQSIAMPTSVSGSNRRLTASGSATSECQLSRSSDGQYVLITGYDAATGTAAVASTTSASVNRVVGRVDAAGAVDTTTALSAFATGNNIRSATSTNGTDLWVAGAAGSPAYTTLGGTTATQISTTVANIRQLHIFGGQLYASDSSGSTNRLGTVGTGTPTTAGQTITNLPGFPVAGSPYSFFFADLDAGVIGVDTLYVADDAAGIQKWSLAAGTWTAKGTIAATSVRGLTGTVSGSTVTLYATYGSTQNTLAKLTDASGYSATISGTLTTLASAGTNTVFRGLVLAPESAPGTEVPEAPMSLLLPLSGAAIIAGSFAVARRRRTV